MDTRLSDYFSKIHGHDNWESRWQSTVDLLRSLGASHVAAVTELTRSELSVFSTMPTAIVDFYREVAYPSGDPRLEYCRKHVAPCHAGVDYSANWNAPAEVEQLDEELRLVGSRSLTVFPVHGLPNQISGCICYMTDTARDTHEDRINEILPTVSLAAQVGFNYWRMSEDESESYRIGLTEREIECLTWASAGYLSGKIAEKMNISYATVRFHLGNARKKLRAKTVCEAVASAISKRVIRP